MSSFWILSMLVLVTLFLHVLSATPRFGAQFAQALIEIPEAIDTLFYVNSLRDWGRGNFVNPADWERLKLKYKAIIFDLDGVICHTDVYHFKAWKQITNRLGIIFDEGVNHLLRGVSRMRSFEIILENANLSLSEEEKVFWIAEKNEYYRKFLLTMSPADLTDEVSATLDKLRSLGLRMAIGSSSKNAGLILRQVGLEHFFDAVVDGNHITKSKPDPEVFMKASCMLGLEPKVCLVVEDAIAGLEAALACGMDCAAIGNATSGKRATYKLNSFSDLLRFLS